MANIIPLYRMFIMHQAIALIVKIITSRCQATGPLHRIMWIPDIYHRITLGALTT